ncbi:stage IV sporulation protein A [Vallitalea guaymasensis]|uniref:Stage IV sporulation protein A n=1 Tax=Vallitalea guaymasensis TaxID=1185412 RepID=A0A8J8SEG8_9FIRM|nr:stage IV sporulation protein A [Vallitalea guaymasensis]QUH31867.1 stage IV sporulation protein A [Vallitalea guaymasensis]
MLGEYDIYKDIRARTNGEIYMGVVGPVRTGKSTFIKRFMDLLVLPNIENVHSKERTLDELPQSAAGKTIMTTEPKFIPQEAARVTLSEDVEFDVRMIDCVGYMVEGATGHLENDEERKVKTPWFNYDIPFTQAAEIGTKKVINDHSTIGIVVTADGSFGEIPRENYIEAEERTINELKKLSKPYVVILNSLRPYSDDTILTATELEDKYNVPVLPVNCDQLKKEDVIKILESVLLEFPLSVVNFNVPKWIEMLDNDHWLKSSLIDSVKDIMDSVDAIRDLKKEDTLTVENDYITKVKLDRIDLSTGCANVDINFNDDYYYDILSDLMGTEIKGEYQFMSLIKKLGRVKEEYDKVSAALNEVKAKGYGIVTPMINELSLQEPEIVKQGNKFGVKLKASAPTIHMIKCDIQTEVSPIVGTEKQSEELLNYLMSEFESDPTKIWDTNVFGKSLHDLVNDGLQNKIYRMPEDARDKLQETLQKIVNDANGGLICIII